MNVPYDEVWIDLYGMGQDLSARTGAIFYVWNSPIVRFDAALYDRSAGFTISPAEWAVLRNDEDAQRALLRDKMDAAEAQLFEQNDGH